MATSKIGSPSDAHQHSTDEVFASAKSANPQFAGRTASVVLPCDGRYGAYTPGDSRGRFLADLGFTPPPQLAALETGQRFLVDISSEQVGVLDGDVLVMLADQPALRESVENDRVLQQVPVVAQGRMVLTDLDTRGGR